MAKEEGETPLKAWNGSITLGVNVCICHHHIALKTIKRVTSGLCRLVFGGATNSFDLSQLWPAVGPLWSWLEPTVSSTRHPGIFFHRDQPCSFLVPPPPLLKLCNLKVEVKEEAHEDASGGKLLSLLHSMLAKLSLGIEDVKDKEAFEDSEIHRNTERRGYKLKRILAATLEAQLKDLQQVETTWVRGRDCIYIHLYEWGTHDKLIRRGEVVVAETEEKLESLQKAEKAMLPYLRHSPDHWQSFLALKLCSSTFTPLQTLGSGPCCQQRRVLAPSSPLVPHMRRKQSAKERSRCTSS